MIPEREGFEPPEPCGSTVFKTASFDHSDTSPRRRTCRSMAPVRLFRLYSQPSKLSINVQIRRRGMIEVHVYPQINCPEQIRDQILCLLKTEWPHTFTVHRPDWPTESAAVHPTSFVLLVEGIVISHAAVLSKTIRHAAQRWAVSGLSSVVTAPSYRRCGFASQIVGCATRYMRRQRVDFGIFTCDPELVDLYRRHGWTYSKTSPLVGGTRQQPFDSVALGKNTLIQLFSERAKSERSTILGIPIFVDLGPGKLW